MLSKSIYEIAGEKDVKDSSRRWERMLHLRLWIKNEENFCKRNANIDALEVIAK